MTDLKPADSVALFDSATAMLSALSAALRGKGIPHLGSAATYGRASARRGTCHGHCSARSTPGSALPKGSIPPDWAMSTSLRWPAG